MKDLYLEKIKNKENLKIDLKNGITIELTFDEKLEAYRGYSKELDTKIGIWTIKTIYQIINNDFKGVEII